MIDDIASQVYFLDADNLVTDHRPCHLCVHHWVRLSASRKYNSIGYSIIFLHGAPTIPKKIYWTYFATLRRAGLLIQYPPPHIVFLRFRNGLSETNCNKIVIAQSIFVGQA